MRLSILIPAFNVEDGLEATVAGIEKEVAGISHEILIVHDITKTEKRKEIEERAAKLKKKYGAKTLFRINQRGFGSALRLGFQKVQGDVVIVMMADLCDDPKTVRRMLGKIDDGYDVVAGSRYMKGGATIGVTAKQHISRIVSMLFNFYTRVKCTDVTNAFKAYRSEVLRSIKTTSESFDISMELAVKATREGFRVSNVPTVWKNRSAGVSKFSVGSESGSYLKWFLYALATMPSLLTLGLLMLVIAAAIAVYFI